MAYLGDDDTLGEARGRDYENALERAAAQGARTYVETYRRSEYGSLTDDVVEEAVAGVLSGVQVLDEGDVGSVLASECEQCRRLDQPASNGRSSSSGTTRSRVEAPP